MIAQVHIDVKEEDKDPNARLAVGNKLLIGKEEFESIDEILASYVEPCADFAGMLMAQDYFKPITTTQVVDLLKKEKKANPKRIPYFLTHYNNRPGNFRLWFQPRLNPKNEPVTVKPSGYKFRNQLFTSPNDLLRWYVCICRGPLPPCDLSHMFSVGSIY